MSDWYPPVRHFVPDAAEWSAGVLL